MAYIEFNNVVKTYGAGESQINALDGANFTVERGELAVILGASAGISITLLSSRSCTVAVFSSASQMISVSATV